MSGAQHVCEPLPEYGVDVGLDSVDERSYVVSCTSPTGEPQACANLSLGGSVRSDCKGTLPSQTGTES